jgi:hypothetical protein
MYTYTSLAWIESISKIKSKIESNSIVIFNSLIRDTHRKQASTLHKPGKLYMPVSAIVLTLNLI